MPYENTEVISRDSVEIQKFILNCSCRAVKLDKVLDRWGRDGISCLV